MSKRLIYKWAVLFRQRGMFAGVFWGGKFSRIDSVPMISRATLTISLSTAGSTKETLCMIKHYVHELVVSTQNAGHAPGSVELDCSEPPTLFRLANILYLLGHLPLPFTVCANPKLAAQGSTYGKRGEKKASALLSADCLHPTQLAQDTRNTTCSIRFALAATRVAIQSIPANLMTPSCHSCAPARR